MDVLATLRRDRVLAVVRAGRIAAPAELAAAVLDAGIHCIELTLTVDGAVEAIPVAADAGAIVGVGTVLTVDQAERALDAGARFLASPTADRDVIEIAAARGVPLFAGALTPTEVLAAHRAGVAVVKLFPARLGGPEHVRDLRAPYPQIELLPSGGIDVTNAAAFIAAGALAVSSGSSTIPAELVERGDHDEIGRRAAALVAAVSSHTAA